MSSYRSAMLFHIVHTTEYEYSEPAVESYTELRVRPRNTLRQTVEQHFTEVEPRVPLEDFEDYFGNEVECLSVPFRHKRLSVTSRSAVRTRDMKDAISGLNLTLSEAVHLTLPQRRELYDFLQPSRHCFFCPEVEELTAELLPRTRPFNEAVLGLNAYLREQFEYKPGVTEISTPITKVIASRQGVCQDFAHVMISALRCAGIPARYVSGYIETDAAAAHSEEELQRGVERELAGDVKDEKEEALIGATASHAWVEVYTPNGHWVGLDPTNNQLESERHVQIGVGRDYHDVPPLRGVFKGAKRQLLSVKVSVRRSRQQQVLPEKEAPLEAMPDNF